MIWECDNNMSTPYDKDNPLHQLIKDEQGIPVPQKYDPEANDGEGGFVVFSGKYSAGDIADLATLLSAFQDEDFAKENTLATLLSEFQNGTAHVQADIDNVTLDTNQSTIEVPASVNQGNAGSEPWLVQQTGSIVALDEEGNPVELTAVKNPSTNEYVLQVSNATESEAYDTVRKSYATHTEIDGINIPYFPTVHEKKHELITVIEDEEVQPGDYTQELFSLDGSESEVWCLVSSSEGNWRPETGTMFSGLSRSALFPEVHYVPDPYSVNNPALFLMLNMDPSNHLLEKPTTLKEARELNMPMLRPDGEQVIRYILNAEASNASMVTIRVLKVWN